MAAREGTFVMNVAKVEAKLFQVETKIFKPFTKLLYSQLNGIHRFFPGEKYLTLSVLLASLLLTFYFGLFISVLAFWLVEMWPLKRLFQGCMAFFGGVIAPLDLLPQFLSSIAKYTPLPIFVI